MGTIDWLAVILAANLAVAVGIVWHGPLFRSGRQLIEGPGSMPRKDYGPAVLVMLIGAVMLGHNYARIGGETLGDRPWLYFMQSGGVAIAFVIPALWLVYLRKGANLRERLIESGFWLAAYLTMGGVFWALA